MYKGKVQIPGAKSVTLGGCTVRVDGYPKSPTQITLALVPVTVKMTRTAKKVTFDGKKVDGQTAVNLPCGIYDLIIYD